MLVATLLGVIPTYGKTSLCAHGGHVALKLSVLLLPTEAKHSININSRVFSSIVLSYAAGTFDASLTKCHITHRA